MGTYRSAGCGAIAWLRGASSECKDPMTAHPTFDEFIVQARIELRRAYTGNLQADVVPNAVAEAIASADENKRRVRRLTNPIGYLYRVGQS